MIHTIQLIYQIFLPPGGILILFLMYLTYEKYKKNRWNRAVLIITFLLYFTSSGFGARALVKPLETTYTLPKNLKGDVLLMMCSGANQFVPDVNGQGVPSPIMAKSMITTLQLYQKTKLPILICGGGSHNFTIKEADVVAREFQLIGVPADKIFVEKDSRNTVEGIQNVLVILNKNGWYHPILLDAALHAPRSSILLEKEKIKTTVYPTYYRQYSESNTPIYSYFIPSSGSLDDSAMAIKEYMGILAIKMGLQ